MHTSPGPRTDTAYALALAYVNGGTAVQHGGFAERDVETLERVANSLSVSDALVIRAAQERRRQPLVRAAALMLAMYLRRAGVGMRLGRD